MTTKLIPLALAAACLVPAAVQAENPKLRPGLWEHSYTMKTQSGKLEAAMQQARQAMAAMSPEQRKMMEDMMGKQGIGLGATGQIIKVCLSKEDAERDQPPQREGCTQDVKRNGSVWKVAFQCKGPPPSRGEGQVTVTSPTAYSGNFTLQTEVEGKSENMQMTQSGKWLGADCGNIRPPSR